MPGGLETNGRNFCLAPGYNRYDHGWIFPEPLASIQPFQRNTYDAPFRLVHEMPVVKKTGDPADRTLLDS